MGNFKYMKNSLLFCFLLISMALQAQKVKSFTPDRQAYLTDLHDFLKETDVNKKDVLEPFMAQFRTVWESGGISDKEAAQIYQISNNFLKKRVSSFQAWSDFIKSIIHLENDEKEPLLLAWLEDLQKFSHDNPARFTEDYLHTTYLTFYDKILYDDGRVRWKVEGANYTFDFDGEPVFTFDQGDIWGFYKNDSTLIENTQGVFYPKRYEFKGQGGNVYFTTGRP